MFAICQELVSCKCTSRLPSIDDDSLSAVCAHIGDHVLSFTSARALHPWWTSQPRSAFRWTRLCHGSVGDQRPWEIPGILGIVNFRNWITHRFNTMQLCTLMIFDVDPGHPLVLSIGPQMTQHMFSEALGRHWSHGQGGLYIQPGPDVASRTYFGLEPGDLLVWGLSEYGMALVSKFFVENKQPLKRSCWSHTLASVLKKLKNTYQQNHKTSELYGIVQTDQWYFAGLQANRPPSTPVILSSSPHAMLKPKSQVHSFDLQHGVWGLKVLGFL